MLEVGRLEASVVLPKVWHVLLLALEYGALVIVADSLLGPERALSFEVDFEGAEEWSLLELAQNRGYPRVEVLQLLDRRTGTVKVA